MLFSKDCELYIENEINVKENQDNEITDGGKAHSKKLYKIIHHF